MGPDVERESVSGDSGFSSPSGVDGLRLPASDYYACDQHALMAMCCWPIVIAQLLQRLTRSKGMCCTTSLAISVVFLSGILVITLVLVRAAIVISHTAHDLPSIYETRLQVDVDIAEAHRQLLIPNDLTTGVSNLEEWVYPRVFDDSFRALVPATMAGDLDWDDLRGNVQPCKRLLQEVLVAHAGRALGLIDLVNVSAPGLIPFCGVMAYQMSQQEYTYLWIYAMAANYLNMFWLGSLCLYFLVVALIQVVRRREGIVAKGRCPVLGDLLYAAFCLPCALSWIIRTEKGVAYGHTRRWKLLSPLGADDEAEVLPVHQTNRV